MTSEGFRIEVSSRFEGWWRYNAALMCGCFDAAEERIGFASASSDIADAGANLKEPPTGTVPDRAVVLTTEPCDHLVLYIYIIPHTLPTGNDIDTPRPFDIDVAISFGGKRISKTVYKINQWSGASIEMKVEKGK